jgi:hypothetical protein
MTTVLWLGGTALSRRRPLTWLLRLTPCTLPIYMIHTYLFIDVGLPSGVAFTASLLLIIVCACILTKVAAGLERIVYAHSAHS